MIKPKNESRYRVMAAALAVLGLLFFIGVVVLVRHTYNEGLKPVSSSQKSTVINVPLNSNVRQVGDILKEQGLIRSEWAFERYIRNQGLSESIQAGTYDFRPSQSVPQIVGILTQGKVATNLVTVFPSKRLDEVRSSLINFGFLVEDVDAALNPDLYKGHPALVDKPDGASLEGYLYPESFQKTDQTKPQDIILKSLDQMQKFLTPEVRAGFVKQGLNAHQGVILASIIEKEVDNSEDRPIVAQVFLRRLRENKPLESDATAVYGAILDGQPPSVTYESPYNTYTHEGLPPGPISNVTYDSINAAVNPAPTDWLYFVSGDPDEKGISKTYFSRTLEEHEALTRQHCKKLCNSP